MNSTIPKIESKTNEQTSTIFVSNKIDNNQQLPSELNYSLLEKINRNPLAYQRISCMTGEGISELEDKISRAVRDLLAEDSNNTDKGNQTSKEGLSLGGDGLVTRERHRRHLLNCLFHLDRFLAADLPMDAAAEELRLKASPPPLFFFSFFLFFS